MVNRDRGKTDGQDRENQPFGIHEHGGGPLRGSIGAVFGRRKLQDKGKIEAAPAAGNQPR